ncbi:hypothetical protein V8C40DRAFT_258315 [Trichoderma camerunense]
MGPAAQPTLPPSATLIGRAAASWCITGASFGAGASFGRSSVVSYLLMCACIRLQRAGWSFLCSASCG